MKNLNVLRALWNPKALSFDAIAQNNPAWDISGSKMPGLVQKDNLQKQQKPSGAILLPVSKNVFFSYGQVIKDDQPQQKKILTLPKRLVTRLPEKGSQRQTVSLTWTIDGDDRLVHANAAVLKCLGIDKKDLNKKIFDIVPAFISHKLYNEHVKVRSSGLPGKKILFLPVAGSTGRYFLINIFPFTNGHGRNLLVGEAFDITYVFQVQQEISETNDRLVNISRVTTEAIWEWDVLNGTVYRNEALKKMIGTEKNDRYDPEWWYKKIHPDDRKRVKEKFDEVLDQKKDTWEHEFLFNRGNGDYIMLHERGFVIYAEGKAVKMIGSLRDITTLKMLESKLVQNELSHKKELAEAKIMGEERERKHIGHELHDNVNQLLATSRLFIGLIKADDAQSNELKSKACEYLETACNEIRNLSHGLVASNTSQVGLINSFEKILNDLALSNTFQVSFSYDENAEQMVTGGKTALIRILQEQLKNIIRYSKATRVDIMLRTEAGLAELTIRDNGVGFEAGKVKKGIGLSNIYERAELHNGKVELNTSPGNGCQLKVTLPLK